MKNDHRMLSLLNGDRPSFFLTVTAGSIVTLLIVFQAYLLSFIINLFFIDKLTYVYVLLPLLLFLVLSVIRALFTWLSENSSKILGGSIAHKVRILLSSHVSRLGSKFLNDEHSGEIVNTLTKGTDALEPYFGQYIPNLFNALISPVIIVCFAFYIDIISGLILIVTAPLIPLFMYLIGGKAKKMNEKQWDILSFLSTYFLDIIQGLTTLKIFGKSIQKTSKISEVSEEFRKATIKTLKVAFISSLCLELIATLSTAVLAVSVGLRLLFGYLGYQEALFILIIAPEFYAPLRSLGASFHSGMEGTSSGKRIFNILETDKCGDSVKQTKKQPGNIENGLIKYCNVIFSYEGVNSKAVDNISLEISPGEKIAFVGETGSGKTSIIKLLMGFIAPEYGNIIIGDNKLSEIDIDFWRSKISWIPQNPYLFNCSIKENICLGLQQNNFSQGLLKKAAEIAEIDKYIQTLENGYDTPIGERGIRLSGGQAQRIAIARAVIKDAPILIMDEPTSNIDSIYEEYIMKNLNVWSQNKTVITVAHRMKTIQNADRIISIKNGCIDDY